MAEYSKIAKGHFTSTGSRQIINLPFTPDYVEFVNYTVANSAASSQNIARAIWDVSMGQGFAVIEGYNATPALIFDTVTTNGISTFSNGLMLQYGATQQVIGITKAAQARVNVTAHGYSVGDTVILQGIAVTAPTNAMILLNTVPFTIVAVSDADHFDINWNTSQSNYTAIAASPAGALVKKVLNPFLYLPEDNVISAVTTGTTTTIATTMYHNFVVGQEIAFRVPPQWGTTQLNSLPNNVIPGSPIYGYVISITDNWTFVCSINSTGFTAFNTNPASTTLPGLTYAQTLAVGDVNTGGNPITSGSPLYPSPQFPTFSGGVPTINGPAILGSFVNNTSQGFVIGTGAGTVLTTGKLVGASTNVIYWRAFLSDLAVN